MDKRSILALVLITVLIIVWLFWNQSVHKRAVEPRPKDTSELTEKKPAAEDIEEVKDTAKAPGKVLPEDERVITTADTIGQISEDSLRAVEKFGRWFAHLSKGNEQRFIFENDLVKSQWTNKGASVKRWWLKEYDMWNGHTTQLVKDRTGQLYTTFLTMDGKKIDSRDLYYDFNIKNDNIKLSGNDSITVTGVLKIDENREIIKRITFYGNKYHFNTEIEVRNLDEILTTRGYDFRWTGGMVFQEENSVDEATSSLGMISLGGDIQELDAGDAEPEDLSLEGRIEFAAIKLKYFGVGIMPLPYKNFDGIVDLRGETVYLKRDNGQNKILDLSFRVPYRQGGTKSNSFLIYVGPLEYDILKEINLEEMVNLGFRFGIRQIGEFFMLPIFNFIHKFIPNYGFAIIIFSILMKILLYPLSIKQMQSARKMQLLGPEMNKIREKYKEDQQKQQKEIMKLYSDYGINPMGGCLPLLLQMPILYALWSVLRSAIELRQEPFILWIDDLSTPDVIFSIPWFPVIQHFSGLALLMGITLFIQQKMTITDPRQKGLVYMMPVMFTLMFSAFPSGLNLYYFMFNLLGIGQQIYINKFSKNQPSLEDMKKSPKKEGWLQKKMREAQDIAESQGRSVPGQPQKQNPNYRKKKKKGKSR